MRKKHFEAIAAALLYAKPSFDTSEEADVCNAADNAWRDTVEQVALALATTNPHFDKARFLKASGLEGVL